MITSTHVLILSLIAFAFGLKESVKPIRSQHLPHQHIQDIVTSVFVHSDNGNWEGVQAAFADSVRLDYTSLAGGTPSRLTPEEITASWSALLPGFDHTHHQLGNMIITIDGNEADVEAYGTAHHYFEQPSGNSLWTVVGTYTFHLKRDNENWKVDAMTFHYKFMTGNTDLPRLAQERLSTQEN